MIEKLNMQEVLSAPATQKTYDCHLALLDKWLKGREETDETLAQYLAYLFEKGQSPGKAKGVLTAVGWRATSEDRPDPRGKLCRTAAANYRRQGYDRGRGQVDGLTWEMVEQVCALATKERTIYGYRDAAVFSIMSDCLLRIGEASAIDVNHLDFAAQTLTIPRSKTDQEGKGAVLYIGKPTIEHVRRWMEKSKVQAGYLFRPIHKDFHRVMKRQVCVQTIRKTIKDRCNQAGFDGRFSGHSFRVGSAISLALRGATPIQMQLVGRWSDPKMPAHYAQKVIAQQNAMALLRYAA